MQFAGIFHKTSEQMSYALNESLFQNGNPRGEIRFWQDIRFLKTGAEIR